MTTPFDRRALVWYLQNGCPLSAKRFLQAAITDGSLAFPQGESADMPWRPLFQYIDEVTEHEETMEENMLILTRYHHLWKATWDDLVSHGFPLTFVFDLLDRMTQGEHPVFAQWAIKTILDIVPPQPRCGTIPDEHARDWQASQQDDNLPFLVPDTSAPTPEVLLYWQVDYPHGVT